MKRRGFLQQAAWLVAATGTIDMGLSLAGNRASEVLAQNAPRKLALLVGIDRYPETALGSTGELFGCATDVQLQQTLLVRRFGFAPEDVLVLTNEQATRAAIESAFQTHLIDRASASDVVLFHFSGYGSQVQIAPDSEQVDNSLVTADATDPDLPLETLWLLLRSLPTQKVVTVLDTSYTYPGMPLQGNLRIRSRPSPTVARLSDAERDVQAQLHQKISTDRRVPGLVLTAAAPHQVATETTWQGFAAGLFSYALTQHLWWATTDTSLRTTLQRASESIAMVAGSEQYPQLCVGTASGCSPIERETNPSPLMPKLTAVGADGAIVALDASTASVRLWLGGLPVSVLDRYGIDAVFSVVSGLGAPVREPLKLQIRSRDGLTAKAQLIDEPNADFAQLEPGQLIRESTRVLPRHLNLTVALDPRLERIERVDATSAFSAIRDVSSVLAGEQPADCLFGRIRRATLAHQTLAEAMPVPSDRGSYGLFTIGRELIPNSLSDNDEAIKKSVQRLVPQLYALLAGKLVALTENSGSSQLAVRGTLEVFEDDAQTSSAVQTLQKQTLRSRRPSEMRMVDGTTEGVLDLSGGNRIRYRLENFDDRPLYYLLFGLDSSGRAISFATFESVEGETSIELQQEALMPGESVTLPSSNTWEVIRPMGLARMQLVCSDRPFSQTLKLLADRTRSTRASHALRILDNPLEIARAILQDLHEASLRNWPNDDLPTDSYVLDTRVWATLDFVCRIV
ncbi:MAG: caspase family protein [Cyanobacteria bacterium SID2]|nr:caspase family protein [Cyanobacteria bacterium SID2]